MAITDYKLNSQGDIDLSTNAIKLQDSVAEAVRQRLQIRLRLTQGEWFLNINSGVPYLSSPFTDKNNKVAVDNFLKNFILETEGIVSLVSYESTLTDRNLSVNTKALTESGEIVSVLGLEIF